MRRAHLWATLTGTAVAVALIAGASAQTTPVKPQPTDPNMPAPQNTVPEKVEPKANDSTGSTGNLSDRLERSEGVITPAETGGGRTVPAPDLGTTPVIPPAGSRGSSQPDAVPK